MRKDHEESIINSWKFRPIPTQSLPDWCDANRRLSPVSSAISGNWLTSRFEIARGPMIATREEGVKKISIMCASQLLKTELLLNTAAYLICNDPAPILVIFPKEDAAKAFAKERLNPMIRATPLLTKIFGSEQRDRSGESMLQKHFPGGVLTITSAASPTNLAMRAVKWVLADEIDRFEASKSEGDPLQLAEARTLTYQGARHIRVSSPTYEGTSRIDAEFKLSDQRKPFVACPQCGHWQIWEFFGKDGCASVEWSKDGDQHFPATAAIVCCQCGGIWDEAARQKAVTTRGAIQWRQTRPFRCACGVEKCVPDRWEWDEATQCGYALCDCGKRAVSNAHVGFWASRLYSPKTTTVEIAEEWLRVKEHFEKKQAFTNTVLGATFRAHTVREIKISDYNDRREKFGTQLDPRIVRLLCGVDVQGNRLELHVIGLGWPEEWWSVHYQVILGDPGLRETWLELEKFLLNARWPHPKVSGGLGISATCIDSGGHHSQMVYDFCRPRFHRNIWATKGRSWDKPGDPVWYNPPPSAKRDKSGWKPQMISTVSAKDHMRHILENDKPLFHIPDTRNDAWMDQLFKSEVPAFDSRTGTTRWMKNQNLANEPWDTTILCFAAYHGLIRVRNFNLERTSLKADLLPVVESAS